MKLAGGFATLLFLLALPVALLASNARWLANDLSFYEQGFAKYGSYQATGLEKPELDRATGELIAYFNSNQDLPNIQVRSGSRTFQLFDQRDSLHLRDVRDLIQLTYLLQEISLAYLLVFSAGILLLRKSRPVRALARVWLWGGVFSAVLLVAIGVAMLVGFDQLFLQFHLVSFSNDLWVLDPATSYLIRMVPEGFFFDLAVWAAGLALAEAILLAIAGGMLLLALSRQQAKKIGVGA